MLPEGVQQWNVYHGEGAIFYLNVSHLQEISHNTMFSLKC